MMTSERKAHLLDRLMRDGRIEAKQVAAELGLSDDTIRRDLRELASEGKLQRVHGGALPKSPADANLDTRRDIASHSKREVGKTAAELIEPGQVVIIDGGTTALQLVQNLRQDQVNTVVTHSPTIAVALAPLSSITVIMIGGVLFQIGLSTGDLEEAHIKKALSNRAADTIVMASSEKLEVASPYVVMPLNNASGIVVDSATPNTFSRQMQCVGLDVHIGCNDSNVENG